MSLSKQPVPMLIDTLRAGLLLGRAEMAVLHAPAGIEAGALYPLTRFLMQRGIKVLPGYGDRSHEHVLRLSHFDTQEHLLTLLKEEFAPWYAREYGEEALRHPIQIDPALTCQSLRPTAYDDLPSRLLGDAGKALRPKAGPAAGMFYAAGNTNLLLSALAHKNEKGEMAPKTLQAVTALSYLTSSVILMMHSGRPVSAESLDTLFDDLKEQELPREVKEELIENQGFFRDVAFKVSHLVKNHPWEVTALINSAGSLSFLVNKIQERNRWGTIGAALNVGSIAVRLLPTKGRESLIDFDKVMHFLEDTPLFTATHKQMSGTGFLGTILRTADTMLGWVKENKLFTSGLMAAAGNFGYFISGLVNKDWGLLRSSLLYLSANTSQAIATNNPAHTLGDVGFAVASYADKLHTQHPQLPDYFLNWQAHDLAQQLPPYHEVIHDEKQIFKASKNMLRMFTQEKQTLLKEAPDSFLADYAQNENHLYALQRNPFLPVIQQETASPSQAAAKG